MVRDKTIRLLPCDYQRTTRYYTIYGTFKSWSSDDFTTIPEAITTISAGTLRLFLTFISYRAKARKKIRRQPSMVPRRPCQEESIIPDVCQANARLIRFRGFSLAWKHRDPAGLAWSAICCTVWHRSITGAHRYTLIYIIIIGRLCCPVQRQAWRWYLWYRWRGGA